MKIKLLLLLLVLPVHLYSQEPETKSINVINYDLDLDIYNCFTAPFKSVFSASVNISVMPEKGIDQISLNADNKYLIVDSVSGSGKYFIHSSNILRISLDKYYDSSEVFSVKIYYRHKDLFNESFVVRDGILYTDCEPEGARKWFPCNDIPSDKALMSISLKVPEQVNLTSNGILADSSVSNGILNYSFQSTKPIATYLIAIAGKVNFNLDVNLWEKYEEKETIQLRYYWQRGETLYNLNNVKNKVPRMLELFSRLYGDYPFEKLAFATTNRDYKWGGMENQTLITLCPDCWLEELACHEIAHQWFGDMITPANWSDIWLNEGFATYNEAIWAEYNGGTAAYRKKISQEAGNYFRRNPGRPIFNSEWNTSVPADSVLFNEALTYSKAGCVIYMLRYVLGDTSFFKSMYMYANNPEFRFGNISTVQFVNFICSINENDLRWFFDQWLNQPNHPVYQNDTFIEKTKSGSWKLDYTINQIQRNSSFFRMPVEFKVIFKNGSDTLIKADNEYNVQKFSYEFTDEPVRVSFDPDNNIILKEIAK